MSFDIEDPGQPWWLRLCVAIFPAIGALLGWLIAMWCLS